MSFEQELADAPTESTREVVRQAEACLDGTIKFAVAADQRGTTMTGICGAVAAAFIAAAATLQIDGSDRALIDGSDRALIMGAYVVAAFLFGAAIIFAWSSRPRDFQTAGYEPRYLSCSASDEGWMLVHAAEDLQRRIDVNRRVLEQGASLFNVGLYIAALSLPAGLFTLFSNLF